MLNAAELIQRADLRETRQLSPVQWRHALGKVFRRTEGTVLPARRCQRLCGLLLETSCITESDSKRARSIALVFDSALPIRNLYIDGFHAQAVPLGILDQHRRAIKAHWLVIENCGSERREVLHFEVCRSVGNQGETGRMAFRESV